MFLALVAFFLATAGSKLLMAAVVIYALFPDGRPCIACGGETIPLRYAAGLDTLARWVGLQRRWCTECGESMTRRGVRLDRERAGEVVTGPAHALDERIPRGRS